jgi:hypothetical protein
MTDEEVEKLWNLYQEGTFDELVAFCESLIICRT